MKYKYFIYVKNDYGDVVRDSLDRRENWENVLTNSQQKEFWNYLQKIAKNSNWTLFWKSIEEINLLSGKLENIYYLSPYFFTMIS
jgi:hypothetical protein